MRALLKAGRRFLLAREEGATFGEYMLLLALIAAVSVVAIGVVGGAVVYLYDYVLARWP